MLVNLISSIVVFIVSMGINFFLTPYILKSLGNEAYGFVGLSNAIVAYAAVITTAINSVSGRFVAYEWHGGRKETANGFYSSVLVVNLFFCVLIALLSSLFIINLDLVLNIPQHLKFDVTLTFVFYFINFCVGLFTGVVTVCAFVRNKLYLISIRNAVSSVLLATLIVVLFYFFDAMIAYIAFSALICSLLVLISTIFMSVRITPELKFSFEQFDFSKVAQLLKSGIWNSFNALNHILLTGMDLFICNIFLGANITGVLSVAKAAPLILESFCVQISSNFAPKMVQIYASGNITALIAETKFAMKVVAFTMSAPAAVFVAFGREFYSLWLPFKNIEEIALIYNLSMISFLPVVLISYVYALFNLDSVTNKLRRPAIANTILGLSVIGAQIAVLKFTDYGIYGVVVAGATLYSARILSFDLINAALNLEIKLTTFYGVYLRNLAIFVITCVIFLSFKNFIEVTNWTEFILVSLALLAVGYALNLFFIFNKNEQFVVVVKILAILKRKR